MLLLLLLFAFAKERVNFYFETLFETGVDENSWDDTVRTLCIHIKEHFKTNIHALSHLPGTTFCVPRVT